MIVIKGCDVKVFVKGKEFTFHDVTATKVTPEKKGEPVNVTWPKSGISSKESFSFDIAHESSPFALAQKELQRFILWIDNAITQLCMTPQEAYYKGFSLIAIHNRHNATATDVMHTVDTTKISESVSCTVHLIDSNSSIYSSIGTFSLVASLYGLDVLGPTVNPHPLDYQGARND